MENLLHKTAARLASVLIASALVACTSVPASKYHESSIKFGGFGKETRILITNLPLNGPFFGVDQDEVSRGRVAYRYRASLYDITNETRYLGSISYRGEHQRTEWIEHKVFPGKHRLMLIAENDDSGASDEPYYLSEKSDVIEVDVGESQTLYVALSERKYRGQPYFHQLVMAPQHASYCENLPEKHYSRRSGAIRAYMQSSHIEGDTTNFFNFCKTLSEQKLMVAASESASSLVYENATALEFSRDLAVREWMGGAGKEQRVDLSGLE